MRLRPERGRVLGEMEEIGGVYSSGKIPPGTWARYLLARAVTAVLFPGDKEVGIASRGMRFARDDYHDLRKAAAAGDKG